MIFFKHRSSLIPLGFFVCCLTLPCVSIRADDFILDPQPMQPSGNKGEIPFEQPADPAVCGLYLENLRYFARRNTPLSCERPIAPHLKDRIQKVEWEDLNPTDYPDLFQALVTKRRRAMGNDTPPIDKLPSGAVSQVAQKIDVSRRAKLPLIGYPYYDIPGKPPAVRQALWYVQFGLNTADSENPNPAFRCKPIRGGP